MVARLASSCSQRHSGSAASTSATASAQALSVRWMKMLRATSAMIVPPTTTPKNIQKHQEMSRPNPDGPSESPMSRPPSGGSLYLPAAAYNSPRFVTSQEQHHGRTRLHATGFARQPRGAIRATGAHRTESDDRRRGRQ